MPETVTRTKTEAGLMTVAETCEYLRLSRGTVYALVNDGRLPSLRSEDA
jgi:predicted DNA-binding transcriptional regulator AlpA